MSDDDFPGLTLTVSVPAGEWAYLKRRGEYLEAIILQILRDGGSVREWFSAAELARLQLPGLPLTKGGITRQARSQGWRVRIGSGRGGERFEYHVTALPARAFDDLVDRIIGVEAAPDHSALPELPPASEARSPVAAPANMAPQWVLPLMRLLRQRPAAGLDELVNDLTVTLPAGIAPSPDEVREMAIRLGAPRM